MITRADEGYATLLRYENIAWYDEGKVRILDRRIYPIELSFVTCDSYTEVTRCIADMVTQSGGPYTAAAMGMALAAHEAAGLPAAEYDVYLQKAAYELSHARPTTAKKMVDVVTRALEVVRKAEAEDVPRNEIPELVKQDAIEQLETKYKRYKKVASYLADRIPVNGTIMTQCFGETIIGTLMEECRKRNNPIKVICAETRPYYQGARLTASVCYEMGFDTTVITDNMVSWTMKQKGVNLFTSASDVITMDGHVVNKIGTLQMAICADYFGVPYYATGFPNIKHSGAESVEIEMRDPELVKESMGRKHVMDGIKGYYPAFDVVPPDLVTGVATDKGIFAPNEVSKYYC